MISQETADKLAAEAVNNIAQVVGYFTELTPKGDLQVGCCPICKGKTPTLTVNTAKGYFYCTDCRKGGNAVDFAMQTNKCSREEALVIIGEQMGLVEDEPPAATPTPAPSEEEAHNSEKESKSFALMELAARTFEENLRNTEDGQAYGLTYFASRDFTDQTIADFRLGYSLRGNSLSAKAMAEGWTGKDLTDNCLSDVNKQTGSLYDFFRGRAMFPIQDAEGRVIAFGARVLDARTKGVPNKYLNSRVTELYKKEETVYGLYQAKEEIRAKGKCYIVEGYTDVISMHQRGVRNVVAGCGTALTHEHVRRVKEYTQNVTLIYDSDSAGTKAALRGIDIVLGEGVDVRVLHLPNGEDPDSFARNHTAEEFAAYVESNEVDFVEFKAKMSLESTGGNIEKRGEATKDIVESIAKVTDPQKREFFAKKCSSIMGISEETIFSQLKDMVEQNAKERDKEKHREQMAAQSSGSTTSPTAQSPATPKPDEQPDDMPDDLSPSEMDMLQANGMTPTATTQKLRRPVKITNLENPEDVAMREIFRYMVTYTQSVLHINDGEQTVEMTVGDYISDMLAADGLEPNDQALRTILNEYRQAPDRTVIDDRYFLQMPDPGVTGFVAEVLGGRPALSKMHSKYSPVELEKDSLDEFVPRAIQELQMAQVMKMIEETQKEMDRLIAEGADDEALDEVMRNLNDLNKLKKEFSMQMGERSIVGM